MSNDPTQERGVSPVAAASRPVAYKQVAAVSIVALMTVAVSFAVWRSYNPIEETTSEKLPPALGVTTAYTAPTMPAPRAPAPSTSLDTTQASWDPAPPALRNQQAPYAPPASPHVAVTAPARPKPYMLTYAAPPPAARPVGLAGPGAGTPGETGPEDGGSKVAYSASIVSGAKAGLLGDQTFLLMPGLLPCVMDTQINTTYEGPVQCHIWEDIRPHGVTLLGRNSIVQAYYRGNMQQGQARVFVQADWVNDPATGCFIKFKNAPLTDSIGQNGQDASIDEQNLKRFGAAAIFTGAQIGMSLGQAAMSKGNSTNINLNSGGGGMDQLAETILRKQIDIPPIGTVNRGSMTAVYVTDVLDFSPCYDLKLKGR